MFGFGRKKKKKTVVQSNKPKLSEYPPEVQAKLLAQMKKIGDDMVAKFQGIMDSRLETAKAAVQNNIDAVPETDANAKTDDSDNK